ncbi:DUF4260 domain-containing protein [Salinarimonas chemoclinalis]|uniref:DUF4260 domain-containing protein n=1 Tax=Salinarimonas chemoclinalis TaxID=3241599 RepID=UPI0035562C65
MASGGAMRSLLRAEGLAALCAAVALYAWLDAPWWAFAAGFLLPDLAILAYLANARVGALVYNMAHSYVGPVALGLVGLHVDLQVGPALLAAAAVWTSHIGFDRALGYGLKHASGFADTHLGPIGRADRVRKA